MSINQSIYLDRIGTENNPQNNMDIERELEIRRIQVREMMRMQRALIIKL